MTIIQSLLDLDLYKLTMNQVQWRRHENVTGTFRLNNRTKNVHLLDYVSIDDVIAECDAVRALRVTDKQARYLESKGLAHEYVAWLQTLELPQLRVWGDGRDLRVETPSGATWAEASLWETLVLAIVNELFCRGWMRENNLVIEDLLAEGRRRLVDKIERLRKMEGAKIIEFGTRRRFSREWQDEVIRTLQQEIPELLVGTSNVCAAMRFGLTPVGTYAHEMPMAYVGIHDDLRTGVARGHKQMMIDWEDEFGLARTVALTDTFGTRFFFNDFEELAERWAGLRHDSGDPVEFGEAVIAYYERLGIDPTTKQIVFSDGLDVETVELLYGRFEGRIGISFGWGTNLTNDLGIPTLSLVMKLVEINGRGTLKLSDNLNKAMGAPEDIKAGKCLFGYTNEQAEELVV